MILTSLNTLKILADETDYYRYPFCTSPASTPELTDQKAPINMQISKYWSGTTFDLPKPCLYSNALNWTSASMLNGDALPGSLVFNTANQQFSGVIPGAGVYSIKVTANTLPYSYKVSQLFKIAIYNNAPQIIGKISS